MPIDPALLAKSIAALTDLDPQRDLAAKLEQAVVAVKQLFMVDAAGVMLADDHGRLRWASASDPLAQTLEDNQEVFAAGPCLQAFASGRPVVMYDATLEPRWGEITVAFGELQVRSGLSVPVQLGGCPIGTLDVYAAAPGGWDATEVSALQTYAGLVATLLGMAAQAQRSGRLAELLRGSLDAPVLIEQATGALRELTIVDLPFPPGRAEPTGAAGDRTPQLDMEALDGVVAALLEREPGADGGIGQKLSLVLLGFLTAEVLPLADRLAGLGIDPTPVLAAASGVLRLYADALERPALRR
jgi:GAF domain-containing protein